MKLFNEDCLALMKSQTFEDLIKGRQAIIVTDPPFNVGYHYKTYKDNLGDEEYYEFLEETFMLRNIPFMGSGTTGVACKQLGIDFIGCELDEEYYGIAKERIENEIV